MNHPESKELEAIAKLGRALRDDPRDNGSLAMAVDLIEGGKGELLLNGLLDARRGGDAEEDVVILGTMTSLEAMMSINPSVAGYLMARLFPIAGRCYLHQVADAIDLWIDASTSAALAASLTRLANEGVRPLLRKRCQAWSAKIRQSRVPTA